MIKYLFLSTLTALNIHAMEQDNEIKKINVFALIDCRSDDWKKLFGKKKNYLNIRPREHDENGNRYVLSYNPEDKGFYICKYNIYHPESYKQTNESYRYYGISDIKGAIYDEEGNLIKQDPIYIYKMMKALGITVKDNEIQCSKPSDNVRVVEKNLYNDRC